MKKLLIGCICALLLCIPLSVEADEIYPVSSFSGFEWAESYFDEEGNGIDGIPSVAGKYIACDESGNCIDFELTEEREIVLVRVENPTCYYEDTDYVPILNVVDEYPLLSVTVDSEGKFVLGGTSNYPDVEFKLDNESVTYKKRVIDLYRPDVTYEYTDKGITLFGKTYKEVGEYVIHIPYDYNLDHYEVINDTYKLTIIEAKKDKELVVPKSTLKKDVSVPKKEKEEPRGVQTGVESNGLLFGLLGVISLFGIVVLKLKRYRDTL